MIVLEDRILLHLKDGRRIPIDPQEIYLLEAEGGETLVRTRRAQQFALRIAGARFARHFHCTALITVIGTVKHAVDPLRGVLANSLDSLQRLNRRFGDAGR